MRWPQRSRRWWITCSEVHRQLPRGEDRQKLRGYIAPEVFTGGSIDERVDIFSIGVMLVETLVGERPFRGQTSHEVLTALLNSEYHLPGESVEIQSLDAVVQRCLARDPRDRYGSVSEVAKELVPAIARCAGFEARVPVTEEKRHDYSNLNEASAR